MYSAEHYALGQIHYPKGRTGTLVYIKASLKGEEPADLHAYLAAHSGFPHQSTTEQFFEESQFESYHRLGLHIGKYVFGEQGIGATAVLNKNCEWDQIAKERNEAPQTIAAGAGN